MRGTAWFDVLQVVPDIEMVNRQGEGEKGRHIELISNHPDSKIFYTLDGSEPTMASEPYLAPFPLKQSGIIKASSFKDGKVTGTIQKQYILHKATSAPVTYQSSYEKYTASGDEALVDGVLATTNYKDGKWQGFHGQDAEFTVDLGEILPVSRVSLDFLQDVSVWIFLPQQLKVSLSADGVKYEKTVITSSKVPLEQRGALIEKYTAEFRDAEARYIKVQAKNIGNCPSWHSGAGQPAWIFLDEVIVE
jgi:hexosaminidase